MIGLVELFICLCIVYYLFNKRTTADMVDVISNRLQEVYGSIRIPEILNGYAANIQNNTINNNNPEERPSSLTLRRFGNEQQRRVIQLKESDKKIRDEQLYHIKEQQLPNIQPPVKKIQGLSCRHCVPSIAETQLDAKERRRDVKDILRITQHAGRRPNSSIFDWGIYCPHLAQVFRLHRFKYPQVAGTVMHDDRLTQAVKQASLESVREKDEHLLYDDVKSKNNENVTNNTFDENYYQEMLKKHEKRAIRVLMDMRSKISDLLLRITSWVLYKLLPCFLSGVAAHPAQIEMLRAATERAPNVPLIFIPLHRSHLDYILVSYILLNNDIRSPIVAAGSNLKIPFFGSLLRGLGAFYIKRKIDPVTGKKDIIYRAVLHTYLQQCLSAGHNVEFFIEGGRTRTGKPCMPKSGILSVIVDAFMDGTVSDALLVPVSVNYERLVDGNFIHEQLGQKKKPESFRSASKAIWKALNSQYGLMRIDFNEPFSLRELVKSFNKSNNIQETVLNNLIQNPEQRINNNNNNNIDNSITKRTNLQHNPSTSSLYGTDVVHEEHRSLIDSIARHVIYDCANATSVMTTNAISFLLLNRFRDGCTMNILTESLDELRKILDGHRDIGFTGNSNDIINYAINLLGPDMIIKEKRGNNVFIKPVINIPNVIELSYYSNSLMPHFALESIIITTIFMYIKEITKNNQDLTTENIGINYDELIKRCIEHCDILRYEFIFNKPCQNLYTLLYETIDNLYDRQLITIPRKLENLRQIAINKNTLRNLDIDCDEDYDDEYDDVLYNKVNNNDNLIYLTNDNYGQRDVLMSVLSPIAHTYLAVCKSLKKIYGQNGILENEFVKLCLAEVTNHVNLGKCKYGESISVDSIRNCIKLLEKWSVIEITNITGVRQICLQLDYDKMNGVNKIIKKLRNIVPFYKEDEDDYYEDLDD